ncbi:MAG: hypothetical protein MUF71_16315 [Candidatus Kapabacteria bacterium]|nr:hypothetical protein [Candidatus Kapabacteria bacterium]
MIETNIFEKWLDAEADRVAGKLANNENLSPDDKLTIVLKGLTNHVAHLDVELRGEISAVRTELKAEIAEIRTELKGDIASFRAETDKRFERLETDVKEIRTDIKDLRKEVVDIHKALNNQVWKIVGSLSLIGAAAGTAGYFLKLWR